MATRRRRSWLACWGLLSNFLARRAVFAADFYSTVRWLVKHLYCDSDMNCRWIDIPGSTNERGWRKTRCTRCGHVTAHWPAGPNDEHVRECPVPQFSAWFCHVVSAATGRDISYVIMAVRFVRVMALSYFLRSWCGQPGSVLSGMLKEIAPQYSLAVSCGSCRQHQDEMNSGGPKWCSDNLDVIVGWLKSSATERGLPFSDLAARALVRRAIATAHL